jgi:adenylate cyclase class IV
MGWKNREIERKFVVPGSSLDQCIENVKKVLSNWDHDIHEASSDFYWRPLKGMKGDFIRVRFMPDGSGQLTVKEADRGENTNRVEIDVVVEDPNQCRKFWEHLIGPSTGAVCKEYKVFFLDKDETTTISVYRVRGDKRIFLEVEAKTLAEVDRLVKLIEKAVTLNPETKSLYQLFVEVKE